MAFDAVSQGAAGVDMGRNIFQCEAPVAMIQAVRAIVHQKASVAQAFEMFQDLRHKK